jgi:hypothetical protein
VAGLSGHAADNELSRGHVMPRHATPCHAVPRHAVWLGLGRAAGGEGP